MSKRQLHKLAAEVRRRENIKDLITTEKGLHKKQAELIRDDSKLKVVCCSRRAGKTRGLVSLLQRNALRYRRSICPYVCMSRSDGKNLIWPHLEQIEEEFKLGMDFKQHTGDVVFPNGSKIIIRGAGSRREVDKLRGPGYPVVVIDEAQSLGQELEYMIDEVLEPASMDFDGQVVVAGTPNAACSGAFHDYFHNPDCGFTPFSWTVVENPFIPDPHAFLERLKKRRGWTDMTPTFRREYLGQWVRDKDALVFNYDDGRNSIDAFMTHDMPHEYVLGVDIGFDDPTAFVVLAFSRQTGRATVLESYKQTELSPTDAAVEIEKLRLRYNFNSIVADSQGAGKGYIEQWKQMGIPVKEAEKSKKLAYVAHMNGDFQNGALKVVEHENQDLITELRLLQWDTSKLYGNKSGRRVNPKYEYDRKFADHLCDALLYGWRECQHRIMQYEIDAPRKGTAEYYKRHEDEMFQRALRNAQKRNGEYWEEFV